MRRLVLVLLLVGAFTAAPAQAGIVSVSEFSGVGVVIWSPYQTEFKTTAGNVTIGVTKDLAPFEDGTTFMSFCVDLQHTISPPIEEQWATLDWMGKWNAYGDGAQDFAGNYASWLYSTFADPGMSQYQSAGLALAIWNVLYDKDFDVEDGAFYAKVGDSGDYEAIKWAQEYLAKTGENWEEAAKADAYWLRLYKEGGDPDDVPQDFIGLVPVPDGGMTVMLLGGALMGLGALRRRFGA